jgi:RNA recognition motif-containing protein
MTSIFVAKLDFNTTDDELRSLFERHGKVNRVTIAKDRETGKPRGFAFVEMFDDNEAETAIEALDNASVNGRNIAVKKADDRGSKPSGGAPSNDRPPRQENRPFRPENRSSEERPAYKKTDDAPVRPVFTPDEVIPLKSERKKEKPKDVFASKDKPKQHKMEAYKKSGKANRFFNDDDDDDDWLLNSRNRSNGWDDDEEE